MGALQAVLAPVAAPGRCLALNGSSGYVDIRLAAPVRPPISFTYEHVPASIAHDVRSAPRGLRATGFPGPPPPPASASGSEGEGQGLTSSDTKGGVPLGSCIYDALAPASRAAQTCGGGGGAAAAAGAEQAASAVAASAVTHVRFEFRGNHGHPNYTCLYRVRVHGAKAGADTLQ